MEEYTRVQRDKLTCYMATPMCEVMRAGETEDAARVRGLAACGLQFLEQYALNGSVELGWMFTLLPDAPMALANPTAPPGEEGGVPLSIYEGSLEITGTDDMPKCHAHAPALSLGPRLDLFLARLA